MKFKVPLYKIYNKGRIHKVLVFPQGRKSAAWCFDDAPEEPHYMIDGSREAMLQVQHALAALIANPSLIIYFPIKKPGDTSYGDYMTFDAVLMRPELQFRRSDWYDIKSKLDQKHCVGKYTIRHNEKKLNDLATKEYDGRYWRLEWDKLKEELLGETVFFVLPKSICLDYHKDITHGLLRYDPDDEYATHCGIGYAVT